MLMYFKGTEPVDVLPHKVEEMERKGWSVKPPVEAKPSSKKGKDDGNTQR